MIWNKTSEQVACGLPPNHHVRVMPDEDNVVWSVRLEDENEDAGNHPEGGDALILEAYGSAATVSEARCAAEQAYRRLCRLARAYQNMAAFGQVAVSS